MNRKILIVMPLGWILVGCVNTGPMNISNCDVYTGPVPPCEGNPNAPAVNLNTNTLNVTPRCANAARSKTIVFTVVPPEKNKVGSVAIIPKNAEDTWLTGTNSPDKMKINILVPDWVASGDHSYGIVASNGSCVDPRVHVVD